MRYSLYLIIYVLIITVPISTSSKNLPPIFFKEPLSYKIIKINNSSDLPSLNTGTVEELRHACANYDQWINNQHNGTFSTDTFFLMGKCQGIMETLGTTMYTLCKEKRRNLGMPDQLSADLQNVRTKTIIHAFVVYANKHPEAWEKEGYLFAINLISKMWPCK
mgnify:CR=1 FL=1